ncbi:MAG: M18 family aminopeptidase [Acidimicrobiales bacterium]|nr:M18 family aminopeptidase [Acidimicrobiales bacterium]
MEPDRRVADDLCSLIDRSPSPYHAVETASQLLEAAGATRAELDEPWSSGAGLRYVSRGGSLVAWRQPKGAPPGFRVIGAHTDSPNLRVKPRPDHVSAHFRQLGVEVYGGALLNSWLDRDLGLSGRVTTRGDDGPEVHLFRVDDPVLRVPQLAIHLDGDIRDKGLDLNAQTHLEPIWDLDTERGSDTPFEAFLGEAAGVGTEDILSWDAMVHDLTGSRRTGRDGVFLSAPRLDNLCSCFAAIRALVRAGDDARLVPVVCLYDHEEVGSTSSTGADSMLLAGVLERIVTVADGARDDLLVAMAGSTCLSADMAHATHPNYADRHEPEHHVTLNEGPVVKVNANQRYASDAESIAVYLQGCADAGIPTQQFVSRTDLPCGSTIGPVTAARLGISTVDVGIAQLAMHSARELCGADDPSWFEASMATFLAP